MDISQPVILVDKRYNKIITEWFDALQERISDVWVLDEEAISKTNNTSSNQRIEKKMFINGRAARAQLRRATCDSIQECGYFWLLVQSFDIVNKVTEQQLPALAIFAQVLAHTRKNNQSGRVAQQLSEKAPGSERPCLSELRFNSLLASRLPEEFCRRLIRAIKMRGNEGINLYSLADSIFLWVREYQELQQHYPAERAPSKRHAVRWAFDYYR